MATETTPLVTEGNRKPRVSFAQVVSTGIPVDPVVDSDDSDVDHDDSFHALDQDDPMEVVNMHEKGGRRQSTTIFKDAVDKHLEKNNPEAHSWLSSFEGILLQAFIIASYIFVAVYESIFKKKALKEASFSPTSMVIFQGVFSVLASMVIALATGRLPDLFNKDTPWKLLAYFPIGCVFTATSYLQFVILEFLAVDVFKILGQGRLLCTAVISVVVFKKHQSLSSWCALLVITLASLCYGQISQLEKAGGPAKSGTSSRFKEGFMLTLVFIFLQCGASVYSEIVLKKDKHTPFWIQKFYQELPGTVFGFLLAWKLDDKLVESGWKRPEKVDFFKDGPFAGWNNIWVIVAFLFLVVKSWEAGFLVKQMSALAKQICGVVSVGLLYFLALVHLTCSDGALFCPENFWSKMSVSMAIADFTVFSSVTSYILAQRDKRRKVMYKEEAEKLKSASAV